VVHSPVTFDITPFTVARRRAWFDAHPATGPHRLLVAESAGRVVGYATSSAFRPRPAYDTSVETSVYCASDQGGRGAGTLLYEGLFTLLGQQDVHRAYAGIALPNDASERLHQKFGFTPLGVYREVGRKFGRYWDVAWFEREL
jgi:phosphinothricin acetyltransferase